MTVLFVVATIILFLTADWIVRKVRAREKAAVGAVPYQLNKVTYPLRLPEGVFFARSHTWLNLFPSGKVQIGVDDFIARLLEHPEIVLLKKQGDRINKGEAVLELREQKNILTVCSPIEGEVLAVNEELVTKPQLLKESLFSEGWGYMMKPARLSDLKQLLLGSETKTWIRNEFQRLKDVFASFNKNGNMEPAFLQDGGQPVTGALKMMDPAVWSCIQKEFLELQ